MKGWTIDHATHEWVKEFNAIDQGMIGKLMGIDPCDWEEVTTPSPYERVYVFGYGFGEIVERDGEDRWIVRYDNEETDKSEEKSFPESDIEIEHYSSLPMWSTMWSFNDSADEYWLIEEDGIRKMSQCGFRIYRSEEFGYFFGIDGAGYDFYDSHWVPLYKARGLRWHDEELELEVAV